MCMIKMCKCCFKVSKYAQYAILISLKIRKNSKKYLFFSLKENKNFWFIKIKAINNFLSVCSFTGVWSVILLKGLKRTIYGELSWNYNILYKREKQERSDVCIDWALGCQHEEASDHSKKVLIMLLLGITELINWTSIEYEVN